MRSQALLAQKPKRVGQLANVGAKVRNKNETAKLFGNFLTVCIILFVILSKTLMSISYGKDNSSDENKYASLS